MTGIAGIYRFQLAESLVQHIVHLVPAELFAELLVVGVLVDDTSLHVGDLSKVTPILVGQTETEAGVVCSAGIHPAAYTHFKCGLRNPQSRCYWKLRQWLALDEVDIVGDQAEAVAHIYDSGCDAMTLLGCEDKTGCRSLAHADAEEVNLQPWLLLCDIRIDLEHVRLQDRGVVTIEVERVVLQE